jgi:uncharacterized protein (TIGR03545 family)
MFPVEIDDRAFASRILKRVHTAGDREFLERLYPAAGDGKRRRRADLDAADARRLAGLAKSIGANRGVVQVPKLVILGVVVVAAVVFNLAFKNPLMTRALVAGLEGVFGARAEVSGLDFRLLGGRIAIDAVAVADRDRPMRNLFELGPTEISIDVFQLIAGNVIVRELACRDLRWDTARAVSGELPGAAPADGAAAADAGEAGAEGDGSGGVLSVARDLAAGLDIDGLVEREAAALASPRQVEAAKDALAGPLDAWTARVAKDGADVEALASAVGEIRAFDLATVKTAKDAKELVDALGTAVPRAASLAKELETAGRDLAADANRVAAARAAIDAAVRSDVAALQGKLDLSPARWKGLAGSLADRALERYLGGWARWARRAWDAAVALVRRSREGAPKAKPLARAGRTVRFPGADRPGFHLVHAAFSLPARDGLPALEATLADVTGDPDLVGRPAVLDAAAVAGATRIALYVGIDARTGADEAVRGTVSADNVSVALREGLEAAGLASLSGTADLRTDLALVPGGGVRGGGSVVLRGASVTPASADNQVAAVVASALREVPAAGAEFTFTAAPGAAPELSLRTNLDEAVAKKVAGQLDRVAADARGAIEDAVRGKLAGALATIDDTDRRYADLQALVAGDLGRTRELSKALADVQKELEKKLKSALPLPKLTF